MREKFILILLLVFASISCKTETKKKERNKESFTLNATLTNIPDSTLFFLKNASKNITIDSAYVINSKLSLNGQLYQKNLPENLTLLSISPEFIYTKLFVKNGEHVTFNADKKDFPWNIDASGSDYHDTEEKFNQIEYQEQEIIKKINLKYGSEKEALIKKITELKDSISDMRLALIKKEINSYSGLKNFNYDKDKFSEEELKTMYSQLDESLKETPTGKSIKLLSQYPKLEIGDTYYDYSALNTNGNTMALSQIKNKYILLHFSSIGCPYNKASFPKLKEMYAKNRDKLEIVSISMDRDKEDWQNHIKRDSIPWPYLWDGKGNFNDANIKYRKDGTPNYVLLSPDKKILESWFGYGQGIFKDKFGDYFKF